MKAAEKKLLEKIMLEADKDLADQQETVDVDGDLSMEADVDDGGENNSDINSFFKSIHQAANKSTNEVPEDLETPDSVLKEYLKMKLEENNLQFWRKYEERNKESKISQALCRVAKKYLTPHATSTNCERLFSTASLILEDRPRLLPENLEKLLFLRENLEKQNIKVDY